MCVIWFITFQGNFFFFHSHRKGLRVITESEIGLAAIFASCDKYCNPSAVMQDSGGQPDREVVIVFFILFLFLC